MKPKHGAGQVQPIVPGLEGGTNWFPPAYDPDLGLFFVGVNQWGMGLTVLGEGQAAYTSPAISTWASTTRCTGWATPSAI